MRMASDLAKRFPEDTIVQFDYLPMIHASLLFKAAVAPRQSKRSLRLLRTSLAPSVLSLSILFTCVAKLMLRRTKEAQTRLPENS